MRNTICAALTAITLALCAALAGCGNASKTSTPAHAIAATGTTCSEESGDAIQECIVTLSDTRESGLRRLLGLQAGRPVLRLEPCEWRGQGTTMKITTQDDAVCIAPEDDEERQVVEITINTLLRWSAEHDKEKEQQ